VLSHEGAQPEQSEGGLSLVTLSELERRHIQKVLAVSGGQMNVAADILGIHRNTLRRKLAEYGIA
jgi:DNA-binding NtrC family response regulator